MQQSTKSFLFIILFCLSQNALSKDYIVEMIFFANNKGSSESVHISNRAIVPDLSGAISLSNGGSNGFIPLSADTFALSGKAQALSNSGKYKVLKHMAWLQPGLAKEDSIAVQIHAGKNFSNEFKERAYSSADFSDRATTTNNPVNELNGTVKIVLGRFLHLYTDLVYRKTFNIGSSDALGRSQVLADFPVKTHRKMRSRTLHYIDHPYLGILIEIRPAG